MTTLNELAAMLDAATGPSRELDALIAEGEDEMTYPDFDREAHRMLTNAVSQCDREKDVVISLRAAYSAGLERAAEIADNDASVGNQEIRVKTAAWRIAKAIRAEKDIAP